MKSIKPSACWKPEHYQAAINDKEVTIANPATEFVATNPLRNSKGLITHLIMHF
jgi:hypothetical protein